MVATSQSCNEVEVGCRTRTGGVLETTCAAFEAKDCVGEAGGCGGQRGARWRRKVPGWWLLLKRKPGKGREDRPEPACTACGVLKGLEGWQWPREVLERMGWGEGPIC